MAADPGSAIDDFESELEKLVDKAIENNIPIEDVIEALEDHVSELRETSDETAEFDPEETDTGTDPDEVP